MTIDFDVSRHVVPRRRTGSTEVVDECMSKPLPRDRPLWQIWIADRLDDGRIGVVGKAHHCMVDGIAAVELGTLLLDPDPSPPRPSQTPGPRSRPRRFGAARARARRPGAQPARPGGDARRARRARRGGPWSSPARAGGPRAALLDAARPAAPTPQLNPPISPLRRLGLLARPMDDLAQIKGGVRRQAQRRPARRLRRRRPGASSASAASPDRLKTMVPVNVRGSGGADQLGNRISFMFVDLPCDEPDPVRRLREIHASTSDRKRARRSRRARTTWCARSASRPRRCRPGLAADREPAHVQSHGLQHPRASRALYMRGCPLAEAIRSSRSPSATRSRSASPRSGRAPSSASTPTRVAARDRRARRRDRPRDRRARRARVPRSRTRRDPGLIAQGGHRTPRVGCRSVRAQIRSSDGGLRWRSARLVLSAAA